jgi:hypothetical protein
LILSSRMNKSGSSPSTAAKSISSLGERRCLYLFETISLLWNEIAGQANPLDSGAFLIADFSRDALVKLEQIFRPARRPGSVYSRMVVGPGRGQTKHSLWRSMIALNDPLSSREKWLPQSRQKLTGERQNVPAFLRLVTLAVPVRELAFVRDFVASVRRITCEKMAFSTSRIERHATGGTTNASSPPAPPQTAIAVGSQRKGSR